MTSDNSFRKSVAVFLFLIWSCVGSGQDQPEVFFQHLPDQDDFGVVEVRLPSGWLSSWEKYDLTKETAKDLLSVHVGETYRQGYPPINGKYSKTKNGLLFMPRFPPIPGTSYSVLLYTKKLAEAIKTSYLEENSILIKTTLVPNIETRANAVLGVFPSAKEIPANILRLYIHFKNAMGNQNPHDFIRLYMGPWTEIQDPFVEVPEGLWDPGKKRLTLLVHPGRVKRGVGPNMTMGPVFKEDMEYTLVIMPEWKDANGRTLGTSYEQTFVVSNAIRQRVEPSNWDLDIPTAGEVAPFTIMFPVLMDRALSARMIQVVTVDDEHIEGSWTFTGSDKEIQFHPHTSWLPGDYHLRIDPLLEDVAGNNLAGVFDVGTKEKKMDINIQEKHITFRIE